MAYEDTITQLHAIDSIVIPGQIDADEESDNQVHHATGQREAIAIVSGPATISGSYEFMLGVGLEEILDLAISDEDGKAPIITMDNAKDKYTGAYITSLRLVVPAHDIVTVSGDWEAKGKTTKETLAAHTITDYYVGTNVVVSGLPAFDFATAEFSISSTVTARHSAKGTGRTPVHLAQGYLNVEASFTFIEDPGLDVLADALTRSAEATVTLLSQTGKELVLTFTDIPPNSVSRSPSEEDVTEYDVGFNAKKIEFTPPAA